MSLMYQAVQHLIVSGPAKGNLATSALGYRINTMLGILQI